MHIPKKFQQNDPKALKDFITQNAFATLISYSEAGLEATHIPFILAQKNGKDVLQGHIAKVNPLWKSINDNTDNNNTNVLVIFNGPDCYISPNHYPIKQETGKGVPTWNYVTVHVKGSISFIHSDEWNLNLITHLSDQHEAENTNPWKVSDAPEEYIHKMLPAIVGIEIEISSMVGQWKVSQNQPERNRQGVIEGLSQADDTNVQKMAELVKEYGG